MPLIWRKGIFGTGGPTRVRPNPMSATPRVVVLTPGVPTIGTATATGSTSATITFIAPASSGGSAIISYTAVSSPGGITGTLNQAGDGTITVTGLTASTAYTFTVYATNSYGNSASSSASNSITTSAAALATNGKLYTWGKNGSGQLGQGFRDFYANTSPGQVGALTTWATIASTSYHTAAIQTNGTLWSWGSGSSGALGLGNSTSYSSPKQVGSGTTWSKIAVSKGPAIITSMAALKTDGTLWSWGSGNSGMLGLGNTTGYNSPKQVGALTNWSKITKGKFTSAAIKTDGTLWSWGSGGAGQIGNGSLTSRSSPVQVGALTSWADVSHGFEHAVAVRTDGTLWAWGYNNSGELGQGVDIGPYSIRSPIQVGASTDWLSVSAARYHTLALKTNGTLWAWGNGGSLGLGDSANRSSPAQVGALTNWLSVVTGYDHTLALKADGTLWAWGGGYGGALGLGNQNSYNSPVQVGSLTTWIKLPEGNMGQDVSAAIST